MPEEHVKKAIGKLIADPDFKKAFAHNPQGALEHSGIDLTKDEISALSKLKPGDIKMNVVKPGAAAAGGCECTVGGVKSFG